MVRVRLGWGSVADQPIESEPNPIERGHFRGTNGKTEPEEEEEEEEEEGKGEVEEKTRRDESTGRVFK